MKYLLALTLLFSLSLNSYSANYKLNEAAVEEAFMASIDLTSKAAMTDMNTILDDFGIQKAVEEGEKQKVAAIVGVISLITGIGILIPIHRFILGTNGKGGLIFLVYCAAGILGGWSWWLTLADVVFIFMDDTKSAYLNNGKILMWIDQF